MFGLEPGLVISASSCLRLIVAHHVFGERLLGVTIFMEQDKHSIRPMLV